MIYFTLFINFIEVFLFSGFIAYVFNLNNKIRYIAIIGMINYIITNISSYYSYDGVFLTIAILFITIVGLIIETKSLNFKTLFIPIIYNIIIILCTSISMEIITYIFSIDIQEVFLNSTIYYEACILSKILQFVLSLFIYIVLDKYAITLNLKEWWIIIVTEFSMIISIGLCLYSLNFGKIAQMLIKTLLFLCVFSNILFYLVILVCNKNYNEKIENARELQEYVFKKQKYKTIEHIKKETDILNHRMFYILWQIEWLAEKKDISKIKETVGKYKILLNKNQYVINSGNDIFDCLISLKLSKCFDNNTDLKVSIAIQKNEFYDNLEFIDCLNNLIDAVILTNKDTDLSILEINSFLVISISIKENKDINVKLNAAVDYLSNKYSAKTKIYFDSSNSNIKMAMPITNQEGEL